MRIKVRAAEDFRPKGVLDDFSLLTFDKQVICSLLDINLKYPGFSVRLYIKIYMCYFISECDLF